MVLMMLDATKALVQRPLLERELHNVGIRLNKRPPNIYFKLKKGGGLSFNATCKLTILSEALVRTILHEYSTRLFRVMVGIVMGGLQRFSMPRCS